MEIEQKFLKDNDILPKISFKDGKPHTVKLLDRKEAKMTYEGEEKEGISYKVEENGTEKAFFTTSVGLISKLVDSKNGETYVIQMKSRKTDDGYRSSFVVTKEGEEIKEELTDKEEIPITEEDF